MKITPNVDIDISTLQLDVKTYYCAAQNASRSRFFDNFTPQAYKQHSDRLVTSSKTLEELNEEDDHEEDNHEEDDYEEDDEEDDYDANYIRRGGEKSLILQWHHDSQEYLADYLYVVSHDKYAYVGPDTPDRYDLDA
jgi:hypothetical protein